MDRSLRLQGRSSGDSEPEQELLRLRVSLLVGEADPPPRRPRHEASPASAPDGRRQKKHSDS